MKTLLVLLLSALPFLHHTAELPQWLVGTWENKTTRGSVYETWQNAADGELHGKSYAVKGGDTLVFETVRLAKEKDVLYYIPTVPNQNQGKAVRFKATSIKEDRLTFENPEHDFPQVITYTRISEDSLVAEISGTRQGQVRKQTFPMRRIK